ncbi:MULTISPECIES: hypothetical protein [Enterobacter]|uniref:hypothetical protein n=1 Tax=Enterobacter TaxID=547 RepID=UPI000EF9EE78|nr:MULTISPECIES: hypothetical protein [Enterobacter]ELP5045553.1 hypothetical protein [Enterobacter ludwigii]ELR9131173.1 hypothetical protein [Enterobacter cloacae]MBT1882959.1 hypothetical protein [Enterobacter mori]RMA89690.1 hypothetical protein BJ885_1650 [Enterobacter sp. WP_7_1]RMA99658.1 hypothetical protein BJ886_1747 [Enterobacter sp. WP_7_2]
MGKMTFVFEYEDGKEPPVSAGMSFMGGKIVAASFCDALEESEVNDAEGLEWIDEMKLQP